MVKGKELDHEVSMVVHRMPRAGNSYGEIGELFGKARTWVEFVLYEYCSVDGGPLNKQKRGSRRQTTILNDCQILATVKLVHNAYAKRRSRAAGL